MAEVTISRRGEVDVLGLAGRLDAAGAPRAEQALRGLLEGGTRRLLIDLRGLDYISSAGLQVLLLAAKRMEAGGGRLALCGAGEYVMDVLKVVGFASFLTLEPDCDQARERL